MNVKAKGYALGAIAAATYGMNPLFAIPVLGIMLKARGRSFKLLQNRNIPL